MIGYASRTGTRRNLAALRDNGWRLMVSATGVLRSEGFRYALDNGAWTAYSKDQPFDEDLFLRAFEAMGDGADFVILPDIVAGGEASMEFSLAWRERLGRGGRYLLPVQDGMNPEAVRGEVGGDTGIFIGGTDAWKEKTAIPWGKLADEAGCWLHVGRVNSQRRIRICAAAGADSFDGSSVSRFAKTIHLLEDARSRSAWLNQWRTMGSWKST